ncbi:MAG TPA: CoA-binding protein [Tenuifilaceae bacterium]|nr:CoA-binding protein [Tenuifilaceae bacterium]HOP05486.1 CoA-binding protein [Tenuifilaceae bacterium]HPE18306.1 CoA-binding protein [Tenuifilaceae bacterium]HPJ46797.1 CoA-binding protein [Tenuifilaceae bacterium]HPQ33104.1 CoA-binding protein [Tenuifilaceae bacterium]
MYKEINEFLQARSIAVVGVSRNEKSFGRTLLKAFSSRGYNVLVVNPNADSIDCYSCYRSIAQLPENVEAAYILKRNEVAVQLAREAATKGIKKIWIHVKCNSPELKEISNEYGVSIIVGECFYMWAEPVKGIHRIHRFLHDLFSSGKEKN